MQANIHPKYEELVLVMTDGTKFQTMSTHGGQILLDVDFRTHQAWTGSLAQVNKNASSVAKFSKKFGDLF